MDALLIIRPLLVPVGLIAIIVWLSYQIMHLLAVLHTNRHLMYRIILFPGILIHELSHLLACWVTNTHVVELNFWSETGGHVIHHKPKNPLFQPFISFAPFAIGISLIIILSHTLTGPWWMIGLKLLALLIISATLAPSKADLMSGLEGLLLGSLIVGVACWLIIPIRSLLLDTLYVIQPGLIQVAIAMTIVWLTLITIRSFVKP